MSWRGKTEEKRRMEKKYKEQSDRWFIFNGVYRDDIRGIFRRAYPYSTNHDNIKKWFRRFGNRVARRRLDVSEDVIREKSGHKKIFDLWWKIL